MDQAPIVTRFAPSPTGRLHLGHAYSALFAYVQAQAQGDRFLLRMEDIDPTRCRREFEAGIMEDLAWLGLLWDQPVRRQSEHLDDYAAALARLDSMGLIYPCFCTRKDIAEAGYAPHGPDGAIYPGLCRDLSMTERAERMEAGQPFALRLNMSAATRHSGALTWHDRSMGMVVAQPDLFGDVVLARKDVPTSYHLAVTVDDALQKVTLVTRGEDLFAATHVHRLLQALLDLPVPAYAHHHLLTDESGRRFAKRDRSLTIESLRQAGYSAEQVRHRAEYRGAALP